jgi:hypothetical protein
MSRTPRRDTSREKRRLLVAELYIKGWTQAAIAQQIGTKQPTISNDLRAIRKMWRQSQIRDFDEAVARELEKIDRVEREAWEAWERTKQPHESTVVTDGQGGKRAQKRVKNQYGDPRYLEQVHKSIAARRALLGLDAPTRIAPTTPDGEQTYHAGVMVELMRLAEHSTGGPDVIDTEFIERHLAAPLPVDGARDDHNQETTT